MRVYLDSCMTIYLIEGAAEMRERVGARLLGDAGARPTIAFTDLSRLECRVKPLATGNAATLLDYDAFFATPGYLRLNLDGSVFDLATELRARHRLTTPDALHLAAAIVAGCDEFWSNDDRLRHAAEARMRVVSMDHLV